MAKDYYSILGVSKTANDDEIKKAFRRLAHEHHPDKGGDPLKFKDVNEAYQVLSDKKKRQMYDQFGSAAFEQGAGPGGFGGGFGGFDFGGVNINMEDFDLGDVLGEMFGFGGTRGGRREKRGRDMEAMLDLSFKEAAFGVDKTLRIVRQAQCSRCTGSGAEPGSKVEECMTCNGKGQVTQAQRTMLGTFQTVTTCPACHGRGKVPEKPCTQCRGTGVERREEDVTIGVPPGVETGSIIKVVGKGEAPVNAGATGDLYVKIRVKPDPFFEREGHDVLSDVTVPFTVLALGGDIKVPTLDGDEVVHVGECTPPGTTFVIKNKGIPYSRSGGRGNHVVNVGAEVPKKLTKEQKRLLEELRKSGI